MFTDTGAPIPLLPAHGPPPLVSVFFGVFLFPSTSSAFNSLSWDSTSSPLLHILMHFFFLTFWWLL